MVEIYPFNEFRVVLDKEVVELFLNGHASHIADFKGLHADSTPDHWEDLGGLEPTVHYYPCVLPSCIDRQHIPHKEVHALDSKGLEQGMSNSFSEVSMAKEGLTEDHCLFLGISLEQVVEDLGKELLYLHVKLLLLLKSLSHCASIHLGIVVSDALDELAGCRNYVHWHCFLGKATLGVGVPNIQDDVDIV